MEVCGFTLQQAEIGAEGIQAVLQLDDPEFGFCLPAFELLEFVERSGEFLLFCFDAFGKVRFDIARLFDYLLHADNFFAQDGILLVGQAELLRVISLGITAAQ